MTDDINAAVALPAADEELHDGEHRRVRKKKKKKEWTLAVRGGARKKKVNMTARRFVGFGIWCIEGKRLAAVANRMQWELGDWWARGHRYGQRPQAVAEGLFGDRSIGSLMNCASVCRAFPISRRREALTFSHHTAVAALPASEADQLLDRAIRERISSRDLRTLAQGRALRCAAVNAAFITDALDRWRPLPMPSEQLLPKATLLGQLEYVAKCLAQPEAAQAEDIGRLLDTAKTIVRCCSQLKRAAGSARVGADTAKPIVLATSQEGSVSHD